MNHDALQPDENGLIPLTPEAIYELGKLVQPALWEREALDITPEQEEAEMERLRADGIDIETLGGLCPVQGYGAIDGRRFYFRARYDSWKMGIAAPGGSDHDAVSAGMQIEPADGAWAYEEDYGENGFDAGWMTQQEALGFIEQAAELFRKAQP